MEKDKKIMVLLCSPHGGTVGGISIWTDHILNYYSKIETNINLNHFYCKGKGAYQNTNLFIRLYIGVISYIPFLLGLIKKIKRDKYDVVHFTSSASISLVRDILSLKIAKYYGAKTIIHFRFGRIPNIYLKKNWEQILLNRVITLSDKVIVLDKQSFNTLTNQGFSNIEILPNPLSPSVYEIIKINSGLVRQKNKLLFAGHVVKTKGVFELVDACKGIDDIKLHLVGYIDDDIMEDLTKLAGENHSNWLFFRGEVSFEETIKEMLSAAVFVLPTYTEGFPNVIIESMACGCPIITTKVGAIPEMFDIENGYQNGICIDPQNIVQLRNAIIKMLNDSDYAESCGYNARERVNNLYSMPKVWGQLESIWKSLSK